MKVKDLMEKINKDVSVNINGENCSKDLPKKLLETEIKRINVETVKEEECLKGYSFEVGV